MGSCHVADEPSDLWRECAIIDVSTLGVGIELCHPDPVDLLGLWHDGELRLHFSRRVTVRFELGPSLSMRVAGEVRNAGSRPNGIVRAGIEFVGLTEAERSIVDRLVREVSVSRVVALGQQKIADPVPVLNELPECHVEAAGQQQKVADPVPVLSEPSESHVEAVGQQQKVADPVPVLSELPVSLLEALGRQKIAEALGWQKIADPVPVVSELPECFVEASGQQKITDPNPALSELARMGGELVFITLRVIGSDVLDLVCRLPAPPRILNVAGWRARLTFNESEHSGEQPVNLTTVQPVASAKISSQGRFLTPQQGANTDASRLPHKVIPVPAFWDMPSGSMMRPSDDPTKTRS
jgi:hypothetical protein